MSLHLYDIIYMTYTWWEVGGWSMWHTHMHMTYTWSSMWHTYRHTYAHTYRWHHLYEVYMTYTWCSMWHTHTCAYIHIRTHICIPAHAYRHTYDHTYRYLHDNSRRLTGIRTHIVHLRDTSFLWGKDIIYMRIRYHLYGTHIMIYMTRTYKHLYDDSHRLTGIRTHIYIWSEHISIYGQNTYRASTSYGVPMISRLRKIIGLFCRIYTFL